MSKTAKITIVTVVLAGVLCGIGLYLMTWSGSTKEIESVASQLKINAQWKQIENQVVSPKTICLDEECPSIHRSWQTGTSLSKESFQQVLDNSDWKFPIQGDCLPKSNITSSSGQTLCSAEGVKDGYTVSLVVMGSYEDTSNGRLALFINK